MDTPDDQKAKQPVRRDAKKDRLAKQLRANLQRRKVQARSRRDGVDDQPLATPVASEGEDTDNLA